MQRVQFLSYGPNQWNCARAQLTISLTGMKVTTEQHNNKSKSLFNKILTFVLTYQLLLSQNARMHARRKTHTHPGKSVQVVKCGALLSLDLKIKTKNLLHNSYIVF